MLNSNPTALSLSINKLTNVSFYALNPQRAACAGLWAGAYQLCKYTTMNEMSSDNIISHLLALFSARVER